MEQEIEKNSKNTLRYKSHDPRLPNGAAVRRPEWLKVTVPSGDNFRRLKSLVHDNCLHTVCESARCPNIGECWQSRTATFLILGNICTRGCAFCAVESGEPSEYDLDEPHRVAKAIAVLELRYAVITSVTRDDLADGGAYIFAETIRQITSLIPECRVEVLIPDFQGDASALETVINAQPFVLNHNVETVPRLYSLVRGGADYRRSLELLGKAKIFAPGQTTKSGIMLGLGETASEIAAVLDDLRQVNCDIVTIGQYLRPSLNHLPVQHYYHPTEFDQLAEYARSLGFSHVEAAPLVRSSYHAGEQK